MYVPIVSLELDQIVKEVEREAYENVAVLIKQKFKIEVDWERLRKILMEDYSSYNDGFSDGLDARKRLERICQEKK